MPDDLDVLTLAEGKQAINMKSSNADQDAVLERHITAISKLLDRECGPVVQRTVSAEVHEDPDQSVRLRFSPVVSIGTVREAYPGETTTLSACNFGGTIDGYYAEPDWRGGTLLSGELLRRYLGYPGDWPSSVQVEVSYTAGRFANTAAVSAPFKDCAGAILRRLWKRESGTWQQSSAFWESIEGSGDGQALEGSGFYRVAKPIIREQLWAEMRMPGVG